MSFHTRQAFVFVAIAVALELATAFTSTAKKGLAKRHECLLARKVLLASTTNLFGTVVDLTDDNFSDLVLSSRSNQRLTLVDCYAPWCGPCRLLESVIEKVAQSYDSEKQVLVSRYNVQGSSKDDNDENNNNNNKSNFKLELALQGCMVRALPALLVLDAKGKVLEHWEGLQTEEFIHEGLRRRMADNKIPEPIVVPPPHATKKGLIGVGTWEQQEQDSYMLSNVLL